MSRKEGTEERRGEERRGGHLTKSDRPEQAANMPLLCVCPCYAAHADSSGFVVLSINNIRLSGVWSGHTHTHTHTHTMSDSSATEVAV